MNEAQVASFDEDPMQDIAELDQQEMWSETTAPEDETSGETDFTSSETNGRPGIDVVLREVEDQLGPQYAEVIRSIQSNYQRAQANWKSGQGELAERLEELEEALAEVRQPEEEEDPNDPLNQLTPEQWQIFHRMAEKAGLVSIDQLEETEASSQQMGFIQSQIGEALEEWGDAFGYRDENGEFQFNPERYDEIEQVYSRVFDPQYGMTARDLFMLADYPRLAQQESQSQQSQYQQRIQQRQRGNVVSRTSQARMGSPIYRKGKDDLDAVVARAAALAFRE